MSNIFFINKVAPPPLLAHTGASLYGKDNITYFPRYHWEEFNFSIYKERDTSVGKSAKKVPYKNTPRQEKAKKVKDMETPKQQKSKKKLYSQKTDGPQILDGSDGQVVEKGEILVNRE